MGKAELAEASALLLGGHLPYLWHDNLPPGYDALRAAGVRALWQVVRPASERDEAFRGLLARVTQQASGTELMALRIRLYELFVHDPDAAQVAAEVFASEVFNPILKSSNGDLPPKELEARAAILREDLTTVRAPRSSPSREGRIPACQECGRQDETLRLVTYPFVVSLLVVTFQRQFSGLWCARHAFLRQALASLITVTIGWFGFPFGLFFTPMALLKLARGGDLPGPENQGMLLALARHKEASGDSSGAIRCLESALRYGPAPAVEAELRRLYSLSRAESHAAWPLQGVRYGAVLLAAVITGLLIGALDFTLIGLISPVLGESLPLYLAMLTWIPLVMMQFIGGIVMSQLLRRALQKAPTRSRLLSHSFAILVALATMVFTASGGVLADAFSVGLRNAFGSPLGIVQGLLGDLTLGAYYVVLYYSADLSGQIYLVLLAVAGLFYLLINLQGSQQEVSWMERLNEVRGNSGGQVQVKSSAMGWFGLLLPGLAFLLLLGLSLIPLGGLNGSPELNLAMENGLAAVESGEWAEAQAQFEEALRSEPASPYPYFGLVIVDMSIGDCRSALGHAQQAVNFSTYLDTAYAYEMLGTAHSCLSQYEEALAAFEQSIAIDPAYPAPYLDRGFVHLKRSEYESAIEAFEQAASMDSNWASPHAALASTYYYMDRAEDEAAAIEMALNKPLDSRDEYMLIAFYYMVIHDYGEAQSYFAQAQVISPNDPSLDLAAAIAQARQGNLDRALGASERALAVNPGWVEAYLVQAEAYIAQEDLNQARRATEQAVAADPLNNDAHAMLAYLHYFAGESVLAEEEARRALSLFEFNTTALRTLSLLQLDAGDLDAAAETAQQVLLFNPSDDVAHYVLGMVHMQRGEDEAAITELEAFLERTWDRAYIRELRSRAESALDALR